MSRKLLIVILSIALLLPGSAAAQTNTTTTTAVITPTPAATDSSARRDAIRDRLTERQTTTSGPAVEISAAQAARKAEIEKLRLAKKAAIDTAREEFQTQLATLIDAKKKEIAEKISDGLATANTNATDRMFAILDKLEAILTKIEAKIADAQAEGTDTTVQNTEVTNAKTALEAAKDAVTEQAANEYIISVGTDTTLRSDVGTVVNQQKQDLRTVYETVRSARQAVRQAAKSLKDLGVMKAMPLPAATTLPSSGSGIVTTPANPIQ